MLAVSREVKGKHAVSCLTGEVMDMLLSRKRAYNIYMSGSEKK